MPSVSFVVVRPIMLGNMVGVTRTTVIVGVPQVQFSDLVVVPGVQRQAPGPDSAAPCVLTTSGTVGLRAEQIKLKEYVDRTLRGLDDFCFFSGRVLPLCHLLVLDVDVFTDSERASVVGRHSFPCPLPLGRPGLVLLVLHAA